jgi:serine/threonine protein kinase
MGHFLMNKCQCDLLVEKLSGVQRNLETLRQSKLHDGSKTILLLQELHRTLLDADALINASCMTSCNWPRAAIEQGDMGRTFSKLLYDMKWCTVILFSILVDNSGMDSKFGVKDCEWELSKEDELKLGMAILEDEKSLRDHLSSVKLDDDPKEIKRGLADQLLKKMDESSRSDLLFLKPEGLDFERNEYLGQGGYGTVLTTNFLGSLCAMKIISVTRHEEVKVTLLKELEVIQKLGQHPHLVRLLCHSQKDSNCYLIMEKMQMDLSKAIGLSDLRDLPINVVSLMLQIGEGVKYIHSKGVAHRDLKPENVLVNLENWPSSESLPRRIVAVKIADFGVSKTKEASKTCSGQTTGTGTTLYMAPEVLKVGVDDPDKAKFNPMKADVFSFAILCSVILTGKSPYHDSALGLGQKKKQVREGTWRPTLPENCAFEVATLIRKCWAGNPSERPLFDEICRELRWIKSLLVLR